jgi:Fe2+ or Zn2+ uptake regulation protein
MSTMMNQELSPLLVGEILQYLSRHPAAGDSVDGITNWWLKRQRFESSVEQVQKVLDWLEERGVVCRVELESGFRIYRTGPSLQIPVDRMQ